MIGNYTVERCTRFIKEWDTPGNLPDLSRWPPVHLGDFPQSATCLKSVVVGHHGRMQPGVLREYIRQNFVPLVPGKVQVDIWRVLPLEVEETLKDEITPNRVYMGNSETVAHHRVGY